MTFGQFLGVIRIATAIKRPWVSYVPNFRIEDCNDWDWHFIGHHSNECILGNITSWSFDGHDKDEDFEIPNGKENDENVIIEQVILKTWELMKEDYENKDLVLMVYDDPFKEWDFSQGNAAWYFKGDVDIDVEGSTERCDDVTIKITSTEEVFSVTGLSPLGIPTVKIECGRKYGEEVSTNQYKTDLSEVDLLAIQMFNDEFYGDAYTDSNH